jgi:hypothetical protein
VSDIGFVEVFDAEVIDCECKCDGFGVVAPETGSERDGSIAEGCEVSAKLIVCQDGGLFEAIHALSDFDVGVTLGVEVGRGKLILFLDILWDIPAMYPHILVYCHVANQKKIFQVGGAISGSTVGIGDYTVPVEFGVDEADGRGSDVLICVK